MRAALDQLKRSVGPSSTEVKLTALRERDYFDFLARLGRLNGIVFVVATDAGVNRLADVVKHRNEQAAKIVVHKDRLHHESARRGLQDLSDQVKSLAPQLYVQLHCQVNLISWIVLDGILYFVQRFPRALGNFRWRIDQKNSTRTEYEKAFVALTPALLQTISLGEPLPMLEGADYSAFQRFEYPEEERPTYLTAAYGIAMRNNYPGLNIGKLIREDLKFEDSKNNYGVRSPISLPQVCVGA